MKLKPLSKLDKRDTFTSRKFGYELVVDFSILDKFGAVYNLEIKMHDPRFELFHE